MAARCGMGISPARDIHGFMQAACHAASCFMTSSLCVLHCLLHRRKLSLASGGTVAVGTLWQSGIYVDLNEPGRLLNYQITM